MQLTYLSYPAYFILFSQNSRIRRKTRLLIKPSAKL